MKKRQFSLIPATVIGSPLPQFVMKIISLGAARNVQSSHPVRPLMVVLDGAEAEAYRGRGSARLEQAATADVRCRGASERMRLAGFPIRMRPF